LCRIDRENYEKIVVTSDGNAKLIKKLGCWKMRKKEQWYKVVMENMYNISHTNPR